MMSHERHSTDGIIADGESRSDDKGKRGVEGCMTTASIFIVHIADAVAFVGAPVLLFVHRCIGSCAMSWMLAVVPCRMGLSVRACMRVSQRREERDRKATRSS